MGFGLPVCDRRARELPRWRRRRALSPGASRSGSATRELRAPRGDERRGCSAARLAPSPPARASWRSASRCCGSALRAGPAQLRLLLRGGEPRLPAGDRRRRGARRLGAPSCQLPAASRRHRALVLAGLTTVRRGLDLRPVDGRPRATSACETGLAEYVAAHRRARRGDRRARGARVRRRAAGAVGGRRRSRECRAAARRADGANLLGRACRRARRRLRRHPDRRVCADVPARGRRVRRARRRRRRSRPVPRPFGYAALLGDRRSRPAARAARAPRIRARRCAPARRARPASSRSSTPATTSSSGSTTTTCSAAAPPSETSAASGWCRCCCIPHRAASRSSGWRPASAPAPRPRSACPRRPSSSSSPRWRRWPRAYFAPWNAHLLERADVRLVVDDGRRYLADHRDALRRHRLRSLHPLARRRGQPLRARDVRAAAAPPRARTGSSASGCRSTS